MHEFSTNSILEQSCDRSAHEHFQYRAPEARDRGRRGVESEKERTLIEAEVQGLREQMVVLSRSERKGTEHAAKSVLLRVSGK